MTRPMRKCRVCGQPCVGRVCKACYMRHSNAGKYATLEQRVEQYLGGKQYDKNKVSKGQHDKTRVSELHDIQSKEDINKGR